MQKLEKSKKNQENSTGDYGIGHRHERGDQHINFTEVNNMYKMKKIYLENGNRGEQIIK